MSNWALLIAGWTLLAKWITGLACVSSDGWIKELTGGLIGLPWGISGSWVSGTS